MSDASLALAENLRALRGARGLTQQALSKATKVPRPTIASIEGGAGNPTLDVLLRLATGLRVTVEELIAAPRTDLRHWQRAELPVSRRGGAEIRRLLPEPIPGVVIERMQIAAGGTVVGTPHTAGTREYLTCESGALTLAVAGAQFALGVGDVVSFRGDQRHSYKNTGRTTTVAFSVVLVGATPHSESARMS